MGYKTSVTWVGDFFNCFPERGSKIEVEGAFISSSIVKEEIKSRTRWNEIGPE